MEFMGVMDSAAKDDRDRRREPRVLVQIPATYRSINRIADVCVTNISRTGLFLCTDVVDSRGQEALVGLTLPRQRDLQSLEGQVVWSRQSPTPAGMGLHYADQHPSVRLALANFILEYLQKMGSW